MGREVLAILGYGNSFLSKKVDLKGMILSEIAIDLIGRDRGSVV